MTRKANQQIQDSLADTIVEDILRTPGDQLLAEVEEDCGNPRAFVATFDRIILKARQDDRAKPVPRAANGAAHRWLPELKRSRPADWLGGLGQTGIPSLLNLLFPNRLVMMAVSSACIAAITAFIAVPEVLNSRQVSPLISPPQIPADSIRKAPNLTPSSKRPDTPASSSSETAVTELERKGGGAGLQSGTSEPVPLLSTRSVTLSPPPSPEASPPLASARIVGGYVVQVTSQRSETDALASFQSLQAKFPKELGDRAPIVRRADLGHNRIYYRAMVGPFGSAGDADQFCSSLKGAGGHCIVQKN